MNIKGKQLSISELLTYYNVSNESFVNSDLSFWLK